MSTSSGFKSAAASLQHAHELPSPDADGFFVLQNVQHLRGPSVALVDAWLKKPRRVRLLMTTVAETSNVEVDELLRRLVRTQGADRVYVPSLEERRADFPILVQHMLADLGRPDFQLGPDDLGELQAKSYPENLRDLKEALRRRIEREGGVRMRNSSCVGERMVGVERPYKEARAEMLAAFERTYCRALLSRHDGNVSRAARAAGIDRVYLHRLMKKHRTRH